MLSNIRDRSPFLHQLPTMVRLAVSSTATCVFLTGSLANDVYYQSEIMLSSSSPATTVTITNPKRRVFPRRLFHVQRGFERQGKVVRRLQEPASACNAPTREGPTFRADREKLLQWIKRDVFEIDPANPDPGQVAIEDSIEWNMRIRFTN